MTGSTTLLMEFDLRLNDTPFGTMRQGTRGETQTANMWPRHQRMNM